MRIIFCGLVALAGCATASKFSAKMDGLVGQPESEVVSRYGVPQGSYTLRDGSRIIEYKKGGTVSLPGASTYEPVTTTTAGNVTMNQGMQQTTGSYTQHSTTYVPSQAAPVNIHAWCTVRFTISKDGTVRAWNSEGNNCVSN